MLFFNNEGFRVKNYSLKMIGELGLMAIEVPEKYGGTGLDYLGNLKLK